jgi:hypothetical protein
MNLRIAMLQAAGACALFSVLAAPARADNQSLYTDLAAAGYEVRSVVFLDPQFTSRYAAKYDPTDTVVITLQNGHSTAACFWYASVWITQDLAARKCSVFK